MRILATILCGGFLGSIGLAADTVYAPMPSAVVRDRILDGLRTSPATDAVIAAVTELWMNGSAALSPEKTLQLALKSWAATDPALQEALLLDDLSDPAAVAKVREIVTVATTDSFRQSNLRSYFGRVFAEQRLYDEALEQFQSADIAQTIDPAATLFYKAAAAQSLLDIALAKQALNDLLKSTQAVPARYKTTAELMAAEIEEVEEKSLGEVARLMSDSERRLDLGRSGEQVQGVQERIIANLDELIKRIEAQGGGGAGGGNSNQPGDPSNPLQDSIVKGSTAPGEVDKKKFSKEGQWGNLPEKKQAEAKNLINRNYPSNYRQAVESYFKKLAGRPAAPGK